MPAIDPFYIATKELECVAIAASGDIALAHCVGYDGAQITAAGNPVRGIAKMEGTDGLPVTIITAGEAVAAAGGAVSKGAALAANASGRLIAATTGNTIFARALDDATTDGQYIPVEISTEGTQS